MKKSLFAYVGAGCLALAGTIVAASSSGPLFSPTDADAVPYGLAATLSERGVALTWSSAIDRFNTTPVTESFENYEPLTDQMGPWTLVDADGLVAEVNFPDAGYGRDQMMSYIVVENESKAHTGKRYIGSVYNGARNDEWLISPRLNPAAQTITFWAHSYQGYEEIVQVMASSTGTDLADFTMVESITVDASAWTRYKAELPEGTTYFALRYYSNNVYYIWIDDISYIPASSHLAGAPARVTDQDVENCLGFNVYRNGQKLTSEPVKALTWLDINPLPGENDYTVTAVFTDGESAQSEPLTVDVPSGEFQLPDPTNLSLTEEEGTVSLSWKAPDNIFRNKVSVTEDFERFTPGAYEGYDLEPWYVVNANGRDHSSSIQNTAPWYIGNDRDGVNRCLITSYAKTLDDWLISPELNGAAQTVTLRACTHNAGYPEAFEVWYSTTTRDKDAFTTKALSVEGVPAVWTTYTVDLPAEALYFAVRCVSDDCYYLYIDDITYTPAEEPAPMRVFSKLVGYNIYRNGEKINSEPVAETTYTDVPAATPGAEYTYGVTALYEAGESGAVEQLYIVFDPCPRPRNLSGEVVDLGIKLTWDGAYDIFNDQPVTESFEAYDHLEHTDLGPWTLYDGDGIASGDDYPGTGWGQGEKFAYVVIDDATQTSDLRKAHTGNKYIATVYNSTQNNEWIISPELFGKSQVITFWAKSGNTSLAEDFEVLYSTTDANPDSFVSLMSREEISAAQWNKYSVALPDGATYFAIRCVSKDRYYMLVDDITFIPRARHICRAQAPEVPTGFNVYREGTRLNDAPVTSDNFTDTTVQGLGEYTYTVTALYGDVESTHSDPCTVTVDYSKLTYPAPRGLVASRTEEAVTLTWNEVDLSPVNHEPVTETFETYPTGPADGELGPWTLINANGAEHNTDQAYSPWTVVTANNGNQYLTTNYTTVNDDWLISPRLNGAAQVLSFQCAAYSETYPEKLEVLVSYSGSSISDFTETLLYLNGTVPVDWSVFTVDIPAGVNYFALRCTSRDAYALCLDDITYTPLVHPDAVASAPAAAPQRIYSKLIGYNVFREGVKLTAEPITDHTYVDTADLLPDHTTVYGVSAVYEGSESAITTVDVVLGPDPVPTGVYAYADQEGLRIDWTPVTFPAAAPGISRVRSLVGYNVYIDGVKVNDTPVEGSRYRFADVYGPGLYAIEVSAVFNNSESALSVPYELTVEPSCIFLPEVAEITASTDGTSVDLAWEAPATDIRPIYAVEDFESYPATTQPASKTSLGPWTLVNRSGAVHYKHAGLAWFVDKNVGHNGSQCLETTYGDRSLDDWLISAELPAIAQTVSFWAACSESISPETVSVQASSTDANPASFTELMRTKVNHTDWREYSVDLPAGTTYFAIRCTSPDAYFLYIDDISYASACTLSGEILGYNVYRRAVESSETLESRRYTAADLSAYERVNAEPLATPGFTDEVGYGDYSYMVTTLYRWGESEPTELLVHVSTSGIEVIGVATPGLDDGPWYNLQGIRVANPQPGQIYIHNGRKHLLR